jgi:hypothetical protein
MLGILKVKEVESISTPKSYISKEIEFNIQETKQAFF